MARPLRIEVPNGVYHVTSRGLERRAIALDEKDGRKWLDLLDAVARRRRWRVFAWVLMGERIGCCETDLGVGKSEKIEHLTPGVPRSGRV